LTTSVGFAIDIAKPPVRRPAAIFTISDGFSPGFNSPEIILLIGTYRPILNPQFINCLYKPADSPLNKDLGPSSLAIVFMVPTNPLYLGATFSSALA